jgi:hypothetical protein
MVVQRTFIKEHSFVYRLYKRLECPCGWKKDDHSFEIQNESDGETSNESIYDINQSQCSIKYDAANEVQALLRLHGSLTTRFSK